MVFMDPEGWWDNIITDIQQTEIVTAFKRITDPLTGTVQSEQDAVYTLINTILHHFVGASPDGLEDRSRELLQNLRCPSLSHFRWYKDVFMMRVVRQSDANSEHWKAKFINGLPTLFAERIRKKLRDKHRCLFLIQNTLMYPSKHKHKKHKYGKSSKDYSKKYRKKKHYKQSIQQAQPSKAKGKQKKTYPQKDKTTVKCYKWGQIGHYANRCKTKIQQKLNALALDDEIQQQILQILSEDSDSDSTSDDGIAVMYSSSSDTDAESSLEICACQPQINQIT
ncbi:uncharacterized protein LOC114275776 [Camellia sinensis]|uniref:uncharacterized protein LOC114275776 n=1 Tax=Camellia sinensis TaxID=4442 RepID=UPI0010356618|nr:uncharacterized protein LOC114275776 [Camellia sinensis]